MLLCFRYVTYISDRYGSHITTPDNCVCTGRNHLDTYKHYDDDSKISLYESVSTSLNIIKYTTDEQL